MLSNSCKYAIRSTIYIQLNSCDNTRKVGIREISKELDLPSPFLGKILLNMAKHNLLLSTKGPHGGFLLARPAKEITLHDIIILFDGQHLFEDCLIGLSSCSSNSHNKVRCPIHNRYLPISIQLQELFKSETIEKLAHEFEESGEIGL
jgi:Rrf2 family protein